MMLKYLTDPKMRNVIKIAWFPQFYSEEERCKRRKKREGQSDK